MNKERLQKLAGILSEAKLSGSDGGSWVVWTYDDDQLNLIGPFASQAQARKYVQWEIEHFDLDDEELHGRIERVYPPEW